MQDAINIAATHAMPQSPAPRSDEPPNKPSSTQEPELGEQSAGVLANRPCKVDLLRDDIGDVQAAQREERQMSRQGLQGTRVNSVRWWGEHRTMHRNH